MIKRIYFLALCMVMVCAGMLYADSCCVTATTDSDSCEDEFCKAPFIPRSQGISLARSYVGSNRFIHEFESNEDSFAWLFSMALGITETEIGILWVLIFLLTKDVTLLL